MHTVTALLCFVVVKHWLIFPYPSGLLHWHCGNLTIAPVPAKQPWWIWINTSCEFIMNDCITTTKQSTTKPCAYFLGYTVCRLCRRDRQSCPPLNLCEGNPLVAIDSHREEPSMRKKFPCHDIIVYGHMSHYYTWYRYLYRVWIFPDNKWYLMITNYLEYRWYTIKDTPTRWVHGQRQHHTSEYSTHR